MYTTKKTLVTFLCFMMILFCSVAYANPDLISQDKIMPSDTSYKTVNPEYGTYTDSITINGSSLIPKKTNVIYKGKPAKYIDVKAKHGDTVKAGDPLVEIRIEVDEYHLAELELKLKRAKEDLADAVQSYYQDVNALQKNLNDTPEDMPYARRALSLRIQKARIQYEKDTFEQNHNIQNIQDELDEIYSSREVQYITAPCDGFIYSVPFFEENSTINTNQPICIIADLSSLLVRVSNDRVSYGMTAQIEAGANRNRVELPADVVVSSNTMSDATDSFALFKPDLKDFDIASIKAFAMNIDRVIFTVKTETVHMDNVLTIPKNATYVSDKDLYVLKYGEDHVIHKRFFTVGLENKEMCYVLYGLDENDSLITN